MKASKLFMAIAGTLMIGLGFGAVDKAEAADYTINNEFNLAPGEGAGYAASPNYIILHETANETATGRNEATYMKRNWFNAYTTDIIGDGGIDYRVGQWGIVSWGAGNANPYAPVQIELQHTHDPALFKKNYKAYVSLARDAANYFGIPLTLDQPGNGIKTHKWVSDNIWGDHQDPYGYLAEMGISKAQLAQDLANGVSSDSTANVPNKPDQPAKPNKPRYKVGDNVRFTTIYKNPDAPIGQHINADTLWTQVGTITKKLDGRKNLYEIRNSGKLLGYANDGDIAEIWNPNKPAAPIQNTATIYPAYGTFTTSIQLPVSGDVDPNSPALDYYNAGMSFTYDGYVVANGYVWLTYINYGGGRSYVAIGPNDNNPANTWGWGF
ncbi:Phage lysin, N-acetylmuramoyl-L-alanine amidase (EC [Enterococcus phage vB_EfaS_140]|uniref:Phage lysin, N-acetylmuramoyl-L-alanine amidase (EC) n=1 Tax=Enterococcus phage vB_EfaS_140 TaxID=2730536 RepID=A0ACA9AS90_9CAUD|nr:Phage lysin, N-acetylmuramoyl-L-alanine amidase (EC [Enterococcus phage vB_EfaS_140]